MSKMSAERLSHLFYLARVRCEDAEVLEPTNWAVDANDVRDVLDALEKRIKEESE